MLFGNYLCLQNSTPSVAAAEFQKKYEYPPKYVVYNPAMEMIYGKGVVLPQGTKVLYDKHVHNSLCYVGPIFSPDSRVAA